MAGAVGDSEELFNGRRLHGGCQGHKAALSSDYPDRQCRGEAAQVEDRAQRSDEWGPEALGEAERARGG